MKAFFKYSLIFLLFFIAAGSIAYYSVRLFTQSADEIVLPKLTDKNIIYVLETLTNMGLNAKLYGTRYHETIAKYGVISQDPPPGATIKRGRDVVIYISKGPKKNIVPDLRQIPLNQALILLEKNEFKQGKLSFTYSSKTKNKSIIAQYPNPFSTVQKGSVCNLLVSRGTKPRGLVMPDLNGLQLGKASEIIKNLHLKISKILSDKNENKAYGIILSYTPGFGSYVTKDTPITLVVNTPDKNRQMDPDKLNSVILLTYSLPRGFLKHHVRVETDMFGPIINLYNEYMKPGMDINILVPLQKKAFVNIFIDHHLVRQFNIDPWKEDSVTGDLPLWESLPPQFYQPISPGLEKN